MLSSHGLLRRFASRNDAKLIAKEITVPFLPKVS
jgi:hypothetical protein